jgi:hypothetical protein
LSDQSWASIPTRVAPAYGHVVKVFP